MCTALAPFAPPACAEGGGIIHRPENSGTGDKPDYDAVIAGLVTQLSKSKNEALDAAQKLGPMGQRVVPILSDLLQRDENPQVKFYAALALSRVKHPSAAQALLPLLQDPKADPNLRLLALGAVGAEGLEEAIGSLQKIGAGDENGDLRFKALLALSVMPNAWSGCEKLFVNGLGDARDDIRQLSAKVCYQVASKKIFYRSGEPKLLELAEKDPIPTVRCNAIAALDKMRSRRAVAVLLRILSDENAPAIVSKSALGACQNITGVPLRDAAGAKTWWEKFGKTEYEKAAPLLPPEQAQEKGKGAENPPPDKTAPKKAEKDRPKLKSLPEDAPADKPFSGAAMGE